MEEPCRGGQKIVEEEIEEQRFLISRENLKKKKNLLQHFIIVCTAEFKEN